MNFLRFLKILFIFTGKTIERYIGFIKNLWIMRHHKTLYVYDGGIISFKRKESQLLFKKNVDNLFKAITDKNS